MRNLSQIAGFLLLACPAIVGVPLFADEVVGARTTIVVKADAKSGRLVRSVVVTPRDIPGDAIAVDPDPAPAPAPANLTEIIDAIAAKHEIEAPLVHSVIKTESNYNPLAISPKGAQGLMQLIPATARRFGVENSFNAQQNIEGGVKYLKFLMELYHNDYVKVIAAYNAGEAAVTKYGGIPPYPETRNYVNLVGKNLAAARKAAHLQPTTSVSTTSASRDREAVKLPISQQAPKPADATENAASDGYHPIQTITGPDGRVYYKTQ